MTDTEATWGGYHHLTINVQNVEKSKQWYCEVLGFTPLTSYATGEFERVILRHPSGVTLGLNRHASPDAAEPFNERRAGLDHVAFQVSDSATLEAWSERFDTANVLHSEIKPAAVPGAFLIVFRDPDGIQLEMFAPPAV